MFTPAKHRVVEDRVVDLLFSHFELALDLLSQPRGVDHLPQVGQIASDAASIAKAGELMLKHSD